MNKQIQNVKDFHIAFGVDNYETPTIPSLERCELRQRILEEEVQELKEAWQTKDIVEVADAVTDCLYILFGTAHEFGIAHLLEQCFEEIQRSNMSKLDENGKAIKRADGKVIKSSLYSKPNLSFVKI